jgi:hypothetical protein
MASDTVRVGPASIVERSDVAVMYLEVDDDPSAIARGWAEFERRLGSLRGRRFLGTIDGDRYRVCVVARDGDDPDPLGLRVGSVRGGRYLRVRLRGDPDAIYARIPDAFGALERQAQVDPDRSPIESYRRHDQVDLLLPVRDA